MHSNRLLLSVVALFLFSGLLPGPAEEAVIKLEDSYYVIPDQNRPDVDNDQDGYSENQGDCDDTNPAIHPGGIETCGDGIDQNCDGSDMGCPLWSVENRLLELVNAERNSAGLPTLVRDPGLDRVIHWHINNMATDHFLSHIDKNGRGAEERAWYYSDDYGGYRCSELIQFWTGTPSGDVHYDGYSNSQAHHDAYMEEGIFNLGPTSHVGVAVVEGTGPIGSKYEGRDGSYSGMFLCDKPLILVIDPFSED